MTNALKTKGKTVQGHKIANLAAPQRRPAQIGATPPFAAQPSPAPFDPRGGLPAPLSLPLSATPFTILSDLGVKK